MKLFKNKKVVVMGLGLHGGGAGVAKFFSKQGADVLVTDLKTKEQLKESLSKLRGLKIEYALGGHRQKDFMEADLIIKNPAVPNNSYFLKVAQENKIPVKTDVGIFFDLCKAPIIGITGTKGKSTVATLVYKLIKSKYKDSILAGNIGVSPLEFLDGIKKKTKVVLELSSFELEGLVKSPDIAVITTIYADHLNRYKDMEDYIEAKKMIFKHQRKKDCLVLNYDSEKARSFAKESSARVYFYSVKSKPDSATEKSFGCFLSGENIFFDGEKKETADIKAFKLLGDHNASNLLGALTVAKILEVPEEKIKKIISSFKGVPNRQEFVAEKNGVKYFNDTTATMPEAVVEAIKAFKKKFFKSKMALIAGGQDKGLDYKDMAKEIKNNVDFLLLLPGTASEKLLSYFSPEDKKKILFAESMEEAVKKARSVAAKGDVVLLSPGAASFNLFKNEFDRGNRFIEAVKEINENDQQEVAPS